VHCFQKKNYIHSDLIWKVIKMEWEAHDENIIFLYRGTKDRNQDGYIWRDENDTIKPHSLSFGLSLFGGILHDKTATVYSYATKQTVLDFYAIPLHKIQFLKHTKPFLEITDFPDFPTTNPNDIFFIPPVPTILELAGMGELFHPRSKVHIPHDVRESRDYFVSGILSCTYSRLPKFLVVANDSDLLSILGFIKSAIPLKDNRTSILPQRK